MSVCAHFILKPRRPLDAATRRAARLFLVRQSDRRLAKSVHCYAIICPFTRVNDTTRRPPVARRELSYGNGNLAHGQTADKGEQAAGAEEDDGM